MVVRCAWGTCNADARYPERLEGGRFVRFPTPKKDIVKCERWIKACGRPYEQLNVYRINQHKAICSKHFVGGDGPTVQFPDPIPAPDGIRTCNGSNRRFAKRTCGSNCVNCTLPLKTAHYQDIRSRQIPDNGTLPFGMDISTQTEEPWVSAVDVLTLTAEIENLKCVLLEQQQTIMQQQQQLLEKDQVIDSLIKVEKVFE